jgi:hypothetical protein
MTPQIFLLQLFRDLKALPLRYAKRTFDGLLIEIVVVAQFVLPDVAQKQPAARLPSSPKPSSPQSQPSEQQKRARLARHDEVDDFFLVSLVVVNWPAFDCGEPGDLVSGLHHIAHVVCDVTAARPIFAVFAFASFNRRFTIA